MEEDISLSRLMPGDPQERLSDDARRRITRALIVNEYLKLEAEAIIDSKSIDRDSKAAWHLRHRGHFRYAKAVLKVIAQEFSNIGLSAREYRAIMKEEVESASNSLELRGTQRHLLESQFYFPMRKTVPIPVLSPSSEPLAKQIANLRERCRLTVEELAEKIGIQPRNVYRHLSGEAIPRKRQLSSYEKLFSRLLSCKIRLETSAKR